MEMEPAAMNDRLDEILDDLFTYHPPTPALIASYDAINEAAKAFARVVLERCPDCPDRTAAIRSIRESRMTANASLATKSGGLLIARGDLRTYPIDADRGDVVS